MNILLVEPNFPIPPKSKNHAHFLPIGLLKIGSYHKLFGNNVQLVRGNLERNDINFYPDYIKITSLFTYWSKYVETSIKHYKKIFPGSKTQVGGIFASLMPEKCKEITNCDEVISGLYDNGEAEKVDIDYSILKEEVDYQIIHTSRGCFRKCNFCGTWKIEPEISYKDSIVNEIKKNKLVLYDNNLLANPNIDNILLELSEYKLGKKSIFSESQSGLDGRILINRPELAKKMKKARFQNPRIAWDGKVEESNTIKKQIDILKDAGYKANKKDADIYLFMLYNHNISYEEMCEKLEYCRKWGVLTIDCRFRPLDSLEDNYKPRVKFQENNEYYIHNEWSDYKIRDFRKKVRRQNISIRLGLPNNKYIEGVEKGFVSI
jgi:hypothetical protein